VSVIVTVWPSLATAPDDVSLVDEEDEGGEGIGLVDEENGGEEGAGLE
jgi:hypothetical protein